VALAFGALLLVALFGEPAGTASSAVLSVELAPELRCPQPSALLATLAARLAPQAVAIGADALGRFQLVVRPHGAHGVSLTLRERETTLVARTVEVEASECGGLADTLALIVESWIDAPLTDSAATPGSASGAPTSSAQSSTPEATPASAVPPEQASAEPTPGAAGALAEPPTAPVAASGAEAGATPRSSRTLLPTTDPELSVPRPARKEHLSIEVAVGTVVSRERPGATARIGLEAARARWLLSLRGHVESARALEDARAISVRHNPLELCAGGLLARSSRLDLAALLGGGADVISARIRGYAKGSTRTLAPLLSFALRSAWRPRPRLGLFAAAELLVSLRRERFVTEGEQLAVTERARARFLLGASWHVF
jgi:hypothetical protein